MYWPGRSTGEEVSGESDEQAFVGSLARIDGERGYESLSGAAARLRVRRWNDSPRQWTTVGHSPNRERGGAVINGYVYELECIWCSCEPSP